MSPLFWHAQPGGAATSLWENALLCSPPLWFLLPWSLVSIVSCSVAMVVQLTLQKSRTKLSPIACPQSDCPWLCHLFSEASLFVFPPAFLLTTHPDQILSVKPSMQAILYPCFLVPTSCLNSLPSQLFKCSYRCLLG